MPFTVSHVAAVLPFVGRRSARILPAAGLVAGSMAPDYPWFLAGGRSAALSHSPTGVVSVDLVAGLVGVLLWRHVLAAPARDLVPAPLARAVPEPARTRPGELPWLALAVVLGATTHVVWDGFTHPGRFGVHAVDWLGSDHAGVPGHQWAQLASGAIGGLVLVGWVTRRLLASPQSARDRTSPTATFGEQVVALLVVLVALLVGALAGLLTAPPDLESMLFRMVTRGGLAAGLGVLLVSLSWHARRSGRVGAQVTGE